MAHLKTKKTNDVLVIWKSTINLIVSKPKVLLPFLLLVVVECISLYILASSPHFPINKILAPPIRSRWGEIYLHYPFIYELLPKMFYYAKVVIGVLVGVFMSGVAVSMISLFRKGQRVKLSSVFFSVLKRYVSLFILAVILYTSVHFLMRIPLVFLLKYFRTGHSKLLFLGPQAWIDILLPLLRFIMAVLIQGLFVYSIPYIVLKGKKFLSALFLGVRLFLRVFSKTVVLISVPMLLYVPVTILRAHSALLADKFLPEIVVAVLFLSILVGTLVVDSLLTISTTLLFMEATDEK